MTGQPRPADGLTRRLARVNPTAAFLLTMVAMLLGLFAPGIIGGAVLLALAGALVALAVTTWPVQTPATRVVRLVIVTLLVAAALVKIY